jgi:polar amino acid transport system permease protein
MKASDLFDIRLVFSQIPVILKYLPVTLELAVVSMIFSLILGLLIALVKMKKIPILTQICNLFISVIRGTPIVVQLYVTYFGIPLILKYFNYQYGTSYNVNGVPAILYAFIALAINEAAFNAEIIRGALQSVDRGQIEAAHALGMTSFQTLRRIILPEAITVALPSLVNSFIGLIKGTSLAFTCAVVEMTAEARIIGGRNYRYFEAYVSLAIIYWIITVVIEQVMKRVENKLEIPDDVPEFHYVESEEKQHDRNPGINETIPE